MSSFFSSVRQGLSRPGNRNQQPGRPGGSPSPTTPTYQGSSNLGPPRVPPLQSSPSLSSSITLSESSSLVDGNENDNSRSQQPSVPRPIFLNPHVQGFIVKGNYMTLAATPKLIDPGEWLAHQVVMQYRLLSKLLEEIQCINENTQQPACNAINCPSMSAGTHTYTWLDANRQPTKLPAPQYIQLVQVWISGKILDAKIFPTDTTSLSSPATYASGSLNTANANSPITAGPTNLVAPLSTLAGKEWLGKVSGFPEEFQNDCKSLYKQMMRIYAHLYWAHFKEPFYDLSNERHLNSSFTHFVTVGTQFDLLTRKDVEPMDSLLELWVSMKIFPVESKLSLWFGKSEPSPAVTAAAPTPAPVPSISAAT